MIATMWPAVWLIWLGSSLNARPLLTLPLRPDPRGVIASRDTGRLALAAPARWDSLTLGDTARVTVRRSKRATPRPNADHVRWSVLDTNVATIDSTGLLRALSLGTATVVARMAHSVAAHLVTVVPFHFVQITTGGGTCGLTSQGEATCWNGAAFARSAGALPARVNGPPLVAISVAQDYACSIDSGGDLHCAGGPTRGAGGPVFFRSISAGEVYACGVASDSTAYCWGSSEFGQVGVSPLHERCKAYSGEVPCTTTPLQLAPRYRFLDIEASFYHTCGILTDHSIVCWGSNSDGQLGDGTTESSAAPVHVAGDLKFSSVTVGGEHTCGVAMDGRGYCWGSNQLGDLGVGDDKPEHDVPTAIAGDTRWLSLSATANDGTCGLTTAHKLMCWGWATLNVVDASQAHDRCTKKTGDTWPCARRPVPEGDHQFVYLGRSIGASMCALDTQGRPFCWGGGSGVGNSRYCSYLPLPTLIGGGPTCPKRRVID